MSATTTAHVTEEKTCIDCHESWPADREFFHAGGKTKDGLMSKCKACYESKRRFKQRSAGTLTAELQGLFSQLIQKQERIALTNY